MTWQPPMPPQPPSYPPPLFQPPRRPAAVEAAFALLLIRSLVLMGLLKLRIDASNEANRSPGVSLRPEIEILSVLFPLGVLALLVMFAVKIRRGSGATAIGMSVLFGFLAVSEVTGLFSAATPVALVTGLVSIALSGTMIALLWLPSSRAYFEGMRPFRAKRPPMPPPGWQPPPPPPQRWGPPPG
ncbi:MULTISPECIES: hypothetical protein [unclassified Crossiella]|uniref:hypothetical protein n=1 Tax=unclassified Crossiella TaxID=2620835 RepID=UPI001FFE7523|nr:MULTISPECIES: hypothetical protein [unclassified Crossiella]MCK2236975.1 hypothetical protein [Crossiella sp. S99.2]MCK2250643.1 hypothetical protein [Crossiella sp. S99.1]